MKIYILFDAKEIIKYTYNMKHWGNFFVVLILFAVSCTGNPPAENTTETPAVTQTPEPSVTQPVQQPVQQPIQETQSQTTQQQPVEQPSAQETQPEPVRQPAIEQPPAQEIKPEPIQQPPIVQPPVQETPPEPVQQPAVQAAEPVQQPPQQPIVQAEEPPQPEVPVYTQVIVSQEIFETTKTDIQQLVEDLNRIIRASNYNSWLTYLSDEYRNRLNSREFIEDLKVRYPAFRTRINNARDYFNFVVVPSRANDKVDDIEFITENSVTAYTLDNHGNRLILYHLENINNKWKITN